MWVMGKQGNRLGKFGVELWGVKGRVEAWLPILLDTSFHFVLQLFSSVYFFGGRSAILGRLIKGGILYMSGHWGNIMGKCNVT